MDRRTFVGAVAGGLLAAPAAILAQPATRVYRLGVLFLGGGSGGRDMAAIRTRLGDLGYVEGRNLVIESRYAQGQSERLPALAADLVGLSPDVIMTITTPAAMAAKKATDRIPIVMAGSADPVGQGLVTSLARPGGNITGLSLLMTELPGKRLELLQETVSQRVRVAVVANPADPTYAARMHNLRGAAQALSLPLHVLEVRSADELDTAFAAISRAGVDALLVFGDTLLLDRLRGRTIDLAAKHHLPAMYDWREHVVAGGLMSYGPSLRDLWRRAAYYVDKILSGATPADLPVEQPTKFEL